ncbi:PREDICTED: uncharacterized protein LOC108553263 [Eufriesea mexicana]|uniref:uncharacterized protein LOC108553263 n=1 Tax=Eufriesea mexicana TaxID=516756 RepID=UPI00083C1260|nr:PREDICTED: uncharacterized protein LOC108553263 [Eufriesea mexicana]
MSQSPDDKFNKSNMLNRKSARRLSINNRELLIAISENDYDKVECLINGEIDINFKDTDGKTPLYWAIESNNDAIIKLLLRKQGINIKRTEIETLIDYVRPLNRPDILKILETSLKSKVADQNAVAEHYQCNSNIDQVLEFSTFKKLESRQKNKIQSKQKIGNNPIHGLVTENVYNKFFRKMLNWLMDKGGDRFLSFEEGKKFLEEAKLGVLIWFNIRDPTCTFVGRDKELSDLHNILQNRSENIPKFVCVSGLGGVGKSELVRRYINQYSQEYDNKIIWINVESYQTLVESFHRLASDKLGVSTINADNKEKKICSIVEDVYKLLSASKCLFIFDNAVKYKSENEFDYGIENFLPCSPCSSNKSYILITSRNKYWPSNVHILELDIFKENEAVEFIKKSLKIETDVQDNVIRVLAKKLHCFPLALQQTVSYIKTEDEKLKIVGSEFKIDNYLEKYNEKVGCFESQGTSNDYIETIVTTWNITFDIISQSENGSNALIILGIASYLASEDISTKIFVNIIDCEDKVGSAILLLKQYSIINLEGTAFSIHKLVQEVIRRRLKYENKDEEILTKALKYFIDNGVNIENMNHAISVWNYTEKCSALVIKYAFVADFIIREFMMSVRYEEAFSFCQRFLTLLNTLSQDNNIVRYHLSMTKNVMGLIHMHQGNYNIAGEIFQKVLNEIIAEPYYLESIAVAYNIGLVFFHQGKYDETLKYYHIALDALLANDGYCNKNTEMLSIQSDIAAVFCKQGKYDIALQMLRKVYTTQKQILGENHFDTLHTQNLVAGIFVEQGKYSEALKMLQEAYDIISKTLNQCHPLVLTLKSNIGAVLLKQGKLDDAINVIQGVLNLQKQVLSSDHPEILETRNAIAQTLVEQGKCDEAMVICQDVLNKREQLLSVEHPDTLHSFLTKAHILYYQGKYEIALQNYTELLSKWKRIFTEDHPVVTTINGRISEISEALCNTAENSEALSSLQRQYEIERKRFGDDHPTTLNTKNNMGLVFYTQKKFDIARQIFEENYNKLKFMLPNHYYTHRAKNNLALVALARGEFEEALRMFREVYHGYRKNLGEDHEETLSTKGNISSILIFQLKYIEASEILCDVIKRHKMILGLEHPDTKTTIRIVRGMLILAMKHNDVKVIEQFFEKCADVTVADLNCSVLLCNSIDSGKADIVNVFLKYGADAASVNSQGKTSLHVATFKGHEQIVKNLLQHTLLEHGAEYNAKNNNDKTPFSLSIDPDIISLLKLMKELFVDAENGNIRIVNKVRAINSKQFKAVINARNDQGNTLFQVLKNNGDKNTLKMYLDVLKAKYKHE